MYEIHATAENRIAEFDINGDRFTIHRDADDIVTVPHADITTAYAEKLTGRPELDTLAGVEEIAPGYGVHPEHGASSAFGGGTVWIDGHAFGLEWDDDAYVCVGEGI